MTNACVKVISGSPKTSGISQFHKIIVGKDKSKPIATTKATNPMSLINFSIKIVFILLVDLKVSVFPECHPSLSHSVMFL